MPLLQRFPISYRKKSVYSSQLAVFFVIQSISVFLDFLGYCYLLPSFFIQCRFMPINSIHQSHLVFHCLFFPSAHFALISLSTLSCFTGSILIPPLNLCISCESIFVPLSFHNALYVALLLYWLYYFEPFVYSVYLFHFEAF